MRMAEVTADKYWRSAFSAIVSKKSLREFVVMDAEPVAAAALPGAHEGRSGIKGGKRKQERRRRRAKGKGMKRKREGEGEGEGEGGSVAGVGFLGAATSRAAGGKFQLSRVIVARSDDLESSDSRRSQQRFTVNTHLGRSVSLCLFFFFFFFGF